MEATSLMKRDNFGETKPMRQIINFCKITDNMIIHLSNIFSGWIGAPMMILFCTFVAFSGTRLGECWVILEERWPEEFKNKNTRQPYMEIAEKTLGMAGR